MARDLWDNPMGTDGFEFVEYTGPEPADWRRCSSGWGLSRRRGTARKTSTLYKQGDINFILNAEPESFAQAFARLHGPSVCAMAFRVRTPLRPMTGRSGSAPNRCTASSGRWS